MSMRSERFVSWYGQRMLYLIVSSVILAAGIASVMGGAGLPIVLTGIVMVGVGIAGMYVAVARLGLWISDERVVVIDGFGASRAAWPRDEIAAASVVDNTSVNYRYVRLTTVRGEDVRVRCITQHRASNPQRIAAIAASIERAIRREGQ